MRSTHTVSPFALLLLAAGLFPLASAQEGGLYGWELYSKNHNHQPHVKLASCSSFQPYMADLATSQVAPHVSGMEGQLTAVEGTIDVFVYLDSACRATSALLPSLKFGGAAGGGGSDAQGQRGSEGQPARQPQEPQVGMSTSAYGFRGSCGSGLVGVYTHTASAGYHRNNLLSWHGAYADGMGNLQGIAPSGANTLPRQASSGGSGDTDALAQATDPVWLASTTLDAILLVPAGGPLLCCDLAWEAGHHQALAAAQAACAPSSLPTAAAAAAAADSHSRYSSAATGVAQKGEGSASEGEQQQPRQQQQQHLLLGGMPQGEHAHWLRQLASGDQEGAVGGEMGPEAPDTCPDTPSAPECVAYKYPAERAEQDLENLCSSMPDMPGCSVRSACQARELSDSRVCARMVLLATICGDMPGMSGCRTYTQLCGQGSVVRDCSEHPPIRRTPSWSASRQAMFQMCKDHPMEQCASCTEARCPDPLASLSGACTDMPDMPECVLYDRWCQANDDGRLAYYCGEGGGSSSGLPSMLMYFHKRVSETVLWRFWVPKTYGQYIGTVIMVLLFGVTSIAIKTCVTMLGIWWKVQAPFAHMPLRLSVSSVPASPVCCSRASLLMCWLPQGAQWWQNAVKAALSGISITFDYWNMLIAMTFNVGLFCAVIVGYILGAYIFASVPDNFLAYLQMVAPSTMFMDCECPKPASYSAFSSNDDGDQEGGRAQDPDFKAPAVKSKACCKAAPSQQQGDTVALLSKGGDIETAAPKRAIHCGVGDSYTTPACCPGIN